MGTIHLTIRNAILGIALTLLTISFLYNFASVPRLQEEDPHAPLEFTDIRIVKLNLSVPHSESDIVRRITIDSDFSFNSPWCQWDDPMALPCPRPLWDQGTGTNEKPKMNREAIPSL